MAATAVLVVLSPIFLLAATAVAFSGRPIFFGHQRLGFKGERFRCWKLRTMRVDAEHLLDAYPELREKYVRHGFKIPEAQDPRITTIGRILRRTYLDELPQLFNVLNGSMSLFGPRPIVPRELRNYGRRAATLLTVKPGLLGAWTSLGRDRPPYPARARLELDYVLNRNVRKDLQILLRAIPGLLAGQSTNGHPRVGSSS